MEQSGDPHKSTPTSELLRSSESTVPVKNNMADSNPKNKKIQGDNGTLPDAQRRSVAQVPANCKPNEKMNNDGVCREVWKDKGDGKK